MRAIVALGMTLALAGCGNLPFLERKPADPTGTQTAAAGPTAGPPPPPPGARTAEQFDTTTAEERAQAAAAPAAPSETRLGTTIASLGDPASPGFWAETPLVTEVRQGRLEYPGAGTSVQVELRPSGGEPGSGTRVSLPALRVLEAPLTALPELVVFGL